MVRPPVLVLEVRRSEPEPEMAPENVWSPLVLRKASSVSAPGVALALVRSIGPGNEKPEPTKSTRNVVVAIPLLLTIKVVPEVPDKVPLNGRIRLEFAEL